MFNTLKKKKDLIDKEVSLYREREMLKVDQEVQRYRSQQETTIAEAARLCLKQLGEYEHEFHYTKEIKGIELAKLETKIALLDDVIEAKTAKIDIAQELLDAKDAEITRLSNLLSAMIDKQTPITIQTIK